MQDGGGNARQGGLPRPWSGCTEVQTYVQSGNAVFGTMLSESALTKAIECCRAAWMVGLRAALLMPTGDLHGERAST